MRKKVRIYTIVIVILLCMGTCFTAMAANQREACQHTRDDRRGQIVSTRNVSHTITLSSSQGPQTCYGSIWIEEVYGYCLDCGYSWYIDTYMHERHNLCGINY